MCGGTGAAQSWRSPVPIGVVFFPRTLKIKNVIHAAPPAQKGSKQYVQAAQPCCYTTHPVTKLPVLLPTYCMAFKRPEAVPARLVPTKSADVPRMLVTTPNTAIE